MPTPKKKYRNKKILENKEDFEYSKEEAEWLGLDLNESENEVFEQDDDDIDSISNFLQDNQEDNDEEDEILDTIKSGKKGKKVDKAKFYVDPKEFDSEIMIYYKTGKLSDNLAEMVNKIAHKLSFAPNFINYSYREEMVGDGIIRMFKALMSKKYNHTKGTNPFSYFTRIAFNAFRNRIKKEKHIHETHEKYKEEYLMFSENYNTMVRNNKLKMQKKHE